jgi:hypothetical protein
MNPPRDEKLKTEEEQHQLLYLGFSIHQEVASLGDDVLVADE